MRGSFIYLLTTSGHFTAKLLVGASSPRAQHNTKSPILLKCTALSPLYSSNGIGKSICKLK